MKLSFESYLNLRDDFPKQVVEIADRYNIFDDYEYVFEEKLTEKFNQNIKGVFSEQELDFLADIYSYQDYNIKDFEPDYVYRLDSNAVNGFLYSLPHIPRDFILELFERYREDLFDDVKFSQVDGEVTNTFRRLNDELFYYLDESIKETKEEIKLFHPHNMSEAKHLMNQLDYNVLNDFDLSRTRFDDEFAEDFIKDFLENNDYKKFEGSIFLQDIDLLMKALKEYNENVEDPMLLGLKEHWENDNFVASMIADYNDNKISSSEVSKALASSMYDYLLINTNEEIFPLSNADDEITVANVDIKDGLRYEAEFFVNMAYLEEIEKNFKDFIKQENKYPNKATLFVMNNLGLEPQKIAEEIMPKDYFNSYVDKANLQEQENKQNISSRKHR